MANHGEYPYVEPNGASKSALFGMESDAAFCTTPLLANAPKVDNATTTADPTFMQNQISIQRSPSTTISQASLLSRKLSTKSNGSHEATGPSISGVLHEHNDQDRPGRGRGRGNSNTSLIEATNNCTLAKSSSNGSVGSLRSIDSATSVREVQTVGSYPLGSLRVHSPSPTRGGTETRSFLKSGDAFIVRDVPKGSLFGYDTRGFEIQGKGTFDGLKDIPPGAHFIWGGSSASSLRNGFWIMTGKKASDEIGEVHVKRWDKENEVLDEEFSAAEVMIQKEGIAEIFDKLQSYTISIANSSTRNNLNEHATSEMAARDPNLWHHLTSSLKGTTLTKITGHKWNHWHVSSTDDYKSPDCSSSPDISLHKDRDEVLQFVFPKSTRTFSDSSSGRDRTEQALDTSSHIVSIIHGDCEYQDSDAIIGELQFCYISGMLLGNLACMEHWAHMVKVLFKGYRLALDLPVFFRKIIEAVHSELIYDHEGLDGSILDHDPNLPDDFKTTLTIFKSRLNELLMDQGAKITPDQEAVGKAFEALESWLWKWNWDLRGNYVRSGQIQLEDGEFVDAELKDFEAEDERGEFAPVVVEMDEDGRERDLIRL